VTELTQSANQSEVDIGEEIYKWASDLFPICRSITGDGVRETLGYIKSIIPGLIIHEVPSGTKAFDWTIPDEWNIREAFIEDSSGERILDFKENNLHVLNYSIPVDAIVSLSELQAHLYSLPERSHAIPYITSYYERKWGFCMSEVQRKSLKSGEYRVYIDSTLEPGFLTYGEVLLPGTTEKEVFLSTYVCHPSLANNEVSGPVVATALVRWLSQQHKLKYSYRIIFGPETIGAIVYLSRHLESLQKNVIAGYNISCVGDDRVYTFLPSRHGNTLSDRTALHVLKYITTDFIKSSFLDRGSDERQYCAPGVDLPIASVMRSRHGEYPEYHTSDDDLSVISPEGLKGGFEALKQCLELIEKNAVLRATILCEPQLGKRNLISNVGLLPGHLSKERRNISNLLAFCDGNTDLLEIASISETPMWDLLGAVEKLKENNLLADC